MRPALAGQPAQADGTAAERAAPSGSTLQPPAPASPSLLECRKSSCIFYFMIAYYKIFNLYNRFSSAASPARFRTDGGGRGDPRHGSEDARDVLSENADDP